MMNPKYLIFMLIGLLATACTAAPTQTPERIAALPTATQTITSTTHVFPPTWTSTATLVPTLTPTITPSPTITTSPTRKPTNTLQPTVANSPAEISLASTIIQLGDLPAGFKEVPMNDVNMPTLPLEEEELAAVEMAFYTNEQNGSSVLSISFRFSDQASQDFFDYMTDHIEEIMQEQFEKQGLLELGLEIDLQVIPDFPTIGDKSAALHIDLEFNEIKSYMEMALFRQDGYGGIVMITPPIMGGSTSLDLRELTLLQHSRIAAFLNGGS